MKKTLLLLCAAIASVGAWAQTNLALNKSAYASSVTTEGGRETWTADKAVDGNTGTQWASDYKTAEMTDDQKNAQWFYVDLGSEQTVNTVTVRWDNQPAKTFDIRYATDDPATAPKTAGTVALADQSGTGGAQNVYKFASAVTARYIILDLKERATAWGYGIIELGVYNVTSTLSVETVTASISKSSIRVGDEATVTYKAYDQIGGEVTPASVSFESSNTSVATVTNEGTVTGVAAGTATITVTADGKTATVDVTVEDALVLPTTAPAAPTGTVHVVYDGATGTWANATWGWGGNTQSDVVIDGKTCRMGQNLGGMQIENSLKDYSSYSKLVVDVWSAKAHTLHIFFEGEGTRKEFSLVAGWNKLEVATSEVTTPANVNYLTFQYSEGPKDGVLIFSNVYYSTEGVTIDEEIATFTATVENVIVNKATDLGLTIKNAAGVDLTSLVTLSTNNGSITAAGVLTATTTGTATITATSSKGSKTLDINVLAEVVLPSIPEEPNADAANVLAVFSAKYGKTELTTSNAEWGGYQNATGNALYTSFEYTELTEGDNTHKVAHVTGIGINSRTAGDAAATGYTRLHAAIYPTTATSGIAFKDNGYNDRVSFSGLTPGQWNYVELSVNFDNNYLTIALDGETEFYIDHIYYTKPGADDVEVTVNNGAATVVGTITKANIADVNNADALWIDLTGVTVADDVTAADFNLKNTNALVRVPGTVENNVATAENAVLGAIKNAVVATNWIFPVNQLQFTDANDTPMWNGEGGVQTYISAGTKGYKITRSIEADKYVTAASAAATTASEGIEVYEFTGYESGTVTFTKKANNQLNAKTPYVLKAATATDLVVEGTGDLNLRDGAQTVTNNEANFVANLFELTTNGTQYILSDGTVKKGSGVKVGAFRAYFTGVAAADGARAIFFDGDDTTAIGAIDADGNLNVGEVYNLRGQRVQNPTKGLYIVNGKKVIMK